MLPVPKLTVPAFLQSGQLYLSLPEDNQWPIQVPTDAFKLDIALNTSKDLYSLLKTLRFWKVADPPEFLIEHFLTKWGKADGHTPLFQADLPYLRYLEDLSLKPIARDRIATVLLSGNLALAKYVVTRIVSAGMLKWDDNHFECALDGNNVEVLAFAVSKGCPVYSNGLTPVYGSGRAQSVPCLEYLLTHCSDRYVPDFNDYAVHCTDTALLDCLLAHGYAWDRDTLRLCAFEGNLTAIRHLHQCGCSEWGGVISQAVSDENLELLQCAHEGGACWDHNAVRGAVVKGHNACLEYLLQHGCPVLPNEASNGTARSTSEHPLYLAAQAGNVVAVQLFLNYGHRLTLTAEQMAGIHCEICRALLGSVTVAAVPDSAPAQAPPLPPRVPGSGLRRTLSSNTLTSLFRRW